MKHQLVYYINHPESYEIVHEGSRSNCLRNQIQLQTLFPEKYLSGRFNIIPVEEEKIGETFAFQLSLN